MLKKCDRWLTNPEHLTDHSEQMDALARQEVCPWARWSYTIGACIDIGIHIYLLFCSWCYQRQLECNPPYTIDFGLDTGDTTARWKFYGVDDPRGDIIKKPLAP